MTYFGIEPYFIVDCFAGGFELLFMLMLRRIEKFPDYFIVKINDPSISVAIDSIQTATKVA